MEDIGLSTSEHMWGTSVRDLAAGVIFIIIFSMETKFLRQFLKLCT